MAIVVMPYNPDWPDAFEQLRSELWPVVAEYALAIEHVGSTSVPLLAAKPIIDIDIIASTDHEAAKIIEALAPLGYLHQGNLGIEGREALRAPEKPPAHHLYVCRADAESLRNHLVLRDHLREHPEDARRYGQLKQELARAHPDDIDSYVEGKTDFILGILARHGMDLEAQSRIRTANRKPD